GWQDREHHLFGFDLLEPKSRFDRFEEGMEVVTRLLQSNEPVTFEGQYFQIRGATLLPRPQRKGGPRILVGGEGKRLLANVVRYAVEWNCVMQNATDFSRLNKSLTEMLTAAGKQPESVRRSMMTNCIFGKDGTALKEKIAARGRTLEQLQQRGIVAGSHDAVLRQLQELEQAGLQRIMLQWLDLDDLDGLEALAKAVL
ncbi:MAG TPA: LLM class flavin-dependent oxidoreductase, partial [Anaerolineales bacterium]|nr:LLM class flavin-dependent oxidoreductase [Anaerolineales bacterium]